MFVLIDFRRILETQLIEYVSLMFQALAFGLCGVEVWCSVQTNYRVNPTKAKLVCVVLYCMEVNDQANVVV